MDREAQEKLGALDSEAIREYKVLIRHAENDADFTPKMRELWARMTPEERDVVAEADAETWAGSGFSTWLQEVYK